RGREFGMRRWSHRPSGPAPRGWRAEANRCAVRAELRCRRPSARRHGLRRRWLQHLLGGALLGHLGLPLEPALLGHLELLARLVQLGDDLADLVLVAGRLAAEVPFEDAPLLQ